MGDKCEWCGNLIVHKNAKRFCCRDCYNKFHSREHYNKYLQDNSIANGQKNMQNYKKFFLEEQNGKCANMWYEKSVKWKTACFYFRPYRWACVKQ